MSLTCISALGEFGFTRTAIVVALGRSSRISPSRFGSRSKISELTPVMLPPGRFRLGTSPLARVAADEEDDRYARGRRLGRHRRCLATWCNNDGYLPMHAIGGEPGPSVVTRVSP